MKPEKKVKAALQEQEAAKPAPNEDDFKERSEGFENELRASLGKYEMAISAKPVLTNDGRIGARLLFHSARGLQEQGQEAKPAAKLEDPTA